MELQTFLYAFILFLIFIIILMYFMYINKTKKLKETVDSIYGLVNKTKNKGDCFSNCFEIVKTMKEIVKELPESKLHFYHLKILNEKPYIKYLLSFKKDGCYNDAPNDENIINCLGTNGIITHVVDNNYLVKLMNNEKTFAFFYIECEKELNEVSERYLTFKAKEIRKLIFEE